MISSLSCGIVVYDEIEEFQRLLPQLKLEFEGVDVQWVIVLNHEQQSIRKWIAQWIYLELNNVICLENPSNNLGFARQLILENANCDYVYLTDPDIDVAPGNLRKLLEFANLNSVNQPEMKIIGYGGTVAHCSGNSFIQETFNFMAMVTKLVPFSFQVQKHAYLVTVDHLPACHLLLNRKLAIEIGGFSAELPRCGEDLDFTHRAYNLGFRFVFLPTAEVQHRQNLSSAKWLEKMFRMGKIQIPVQRINFSSGIRFYRLIPLFALVGLLALVSISLLFKIYFFFAFLILGIFVPGFIGFSLTVITYAFGELYELFVPLFEYKDVKELEELKLTLKKQSFVATP